MTDSVVTKRDIIDFFYPRCEGLNYWGGWDRFFEPCIPSRLFDDGFRHLRAAIRSRDVSGLVEFLSSEHLKKLSQAGRGENDVLCVPTSDAKRAVDLLKSYGR